MSFYYPEVLREHGKCANDVILQNKIFYLRDDEGESIYDFFHEKQFISMAKEYCSDCPVKDICFNMAMMDTDGYTGIWGGTTHRERRALQRKIQKKQAAAQLLLAQLTEQLPDDTGPTAA